MWDPDNTTDSETDTGDDETDTGDDETIAESSEKTEHSSRFGRHREQRKSPQVSRSSNYFVKTFTDSGTGTDNELYHQ